MAISNVKNPVGGGAGAAGAVGAVGGGPATGEASKAQAAAKAAAAAAGYAKQAQSAPTVRDAANVTISPRAKEMNLARAVVDQTPDVREDKVAKYKAAIASGEYKVDSGKVADGILGEALRDELSRTPNVAHD